MCRSIKTLRDADRPIDDAEIEAAALQFVRKVSGYRAPSRVNAPRLRRRRRRGRPRHPSYARPTPRERRRCSWPRLALTGVRMRRLLLILLATIAALLLAACSDGAGPEVEELQRDVEELQEHVDVLTREVEIARDARGELEEDLKDLEDARVGRGAGERRDRPRRQRRRRCGCVRR